MSKTTKRPDTFGDGTEYQGHDLALAGMDAIWSVGATPRDAIVALCEARWGGKLEGELRPLDADDAYQWGHRFTSDGTHFKAAGINVPGGVVLTWWM